jgi:hypothetical protein
MNDLQRFSPILCVLFTLLFSSICKKSSIWYNPIYQFLILFPRQLESYPESLCLLLCSNYFLMFSSSSFKALGLTIRYLIHFELSFVQSKNRCTCVYLGFPTTLIEETVLQHMFIDFLSKKSDHYTVWFYAWVFYSIPLVCMSVLCQYHVVLLTVALQ